MSSTRVFLAGVGTTFAILVMGFGAGLLFATTTPDRPTQFAPKTERSADVRVVLPPSSVPVPGVITASSTPDEQGTALPGNAMETTPVPDDREIAKRDQRRAERVRSAERRKFAERKARRAAARARDMQRPEPRIMAFGSDPFWQ